MSTRYLNAKAARAYCHEQGRQVSAEALAVLDQHVADCLRRACTNHWAGHKARVSGTEAALACGNTAARILLNGG